MPSIFFTPTERQVVAPVDLNQYATTMDTLQKKHENTITQFAAFKEALAKLPINPAEQGYLNQKVANLQNALDSRLQYGNAAFAFDDIVREYGDIMSDPGMVGRLNAQKDYQAYLDNLNSRTDITEDTKEMYREKNPYYYNPAYNELGQEIGGSKWEPTSRPTSTVDIFTLMQKAANIVAEETGSSNQIYYMDANGQFTTDYNASVDGLPYLSKSGSFSRISKEKLREALNAAIANTPGAMASLQQDFEVGNWKYNKNGGEGVSDITDEKGVKLNFDQYLDKRFTGFYNSATKNNYSSSTQTLAGMSVEAAKARAANAAATSGYNMGLDSLTTTPGPYVQRKESAYSSAIGKVTAATQILRSAAQDNNIPFDLNDIDTSWEALKKFYGTKIPRNIWDAYQDYKESIDLYNAVVPENTSKETKDRLAFVSAIDNGTDLSLLKDENGKLNPLVSEYSKAINDIYYNADGTKIPLNVSVAQFISTNPDWKDYGLQIKRDANGKESLYLPKENANNIPRVVNAFSNYLPTGLFGTSFSLTNAVDVSQADKLKNAAKLYNNANNAMVKAAQGVGINDILDPLELTSSEDIIENIQKPYGFDDTEYKRQQDNVRAMFNSNLENSQGAVLRNMYVGVDGGVMTGDLDGTQRNAITQLLHQAMIADRNAVSLSFDKQLMDSYVQITLSDKIKNIDGYSNMLKAAGLSDAKTTISFTASNLINDSVKHALLQSNAVKGSYSLHQDELIGINEWAVPGGLQVVKDSGKYYMTDGTNVLPITKSQAVSAIKNAKDNERNIAYELSKFENGVFPEEYSSGFANAIVSIVREVVPGNEKARSFEELNIMGQIAAKNIQKELNNY